MNKSVFYMLVVVCVITHIIRTIYEILKHRNQIKPDKLSFVIVFINMMLLWISWFTLCSLDVYRIKLISIFRISGFLLVGVGLIVFLIALFTIKTLESYEGELITKGIYSKIRHPMYLGFILWLIGFPIGFGAFFPFLLSFFFIANVLFWRYLEEKELEQRFPTYLDYKKTTFF